MLFRLLIFFKINFFEKISEIPSECQTDWIQIRPDVLSGLIWVQAVCQSYQQTTLGDKELMFMNPGYKGTTLYFSPYGPQHEKTCLQGFANNTGADQPVHPRSLVSAFVILFLVSNIFNLATHKISIF